MANPHSSNQQRSVWALDISCAFSFFLFFFQDEIMKKTIVNNVCFCLFCPQLEKRGERRAEAEKQLAKAQETGNVNAFPI